MTHDPDTLERQGAEWASRLIQRAIDDRNEARSLLDDAKRQIDALTLSLDDLRASLGEAEAVLDVWRKRAERAEAELVKLQPIGGKPWWIRPKPDGYDPGARKDDETPIKTERPSAGGRHRGLVGGARSQPPSREAGRSPLGPSP